MWRIYILVLGSWVQVSCASSDAELARTVTELRREGQMVQWRPSQSVSDQLRDIQRDVDSILAEQRKLWPVRRPR
jgi:uncharacterized lipoprotein YajG